MTNLVINGIPERFPKLKMIWIESGLAWVPFLMQRLDNEYMMRTSEAPLLKRLPSEYMARASTTPPSRWRDREPRGAADDDEDDQRRDAALFASDYPHWDFNLPSTIYDLPFLSEARQAAHPRRRTPATSSSSSGRRDARRTRWPGQDARLRARLRAPTAARSLLAARTPARMRSGGLLRHPDFLKLWSAETISQVRDQVSLLAIPLDRDRHPRASRRSSSPCSATIEFLPFILFSLPAGVWVDRLRRRPILIAGDIGAGGRARSRSRSRTSSTS